MMLRWYIPNRCYLQNFHVDSKIVPKPAVVSNNFIFTIYKCSVLTGFLLLFKIVFVCIYPVVKTVVVKIGKQTWFEILKNIALSA